MVDDNFSTSNTPAPVPVWLTKRSLCSNISFYESENSSCLHLHRCIHPLLGEWEFITWLVSLKIIWLLLKWFDFRKKPSDIWIAIIQNATQQRRYIACARTALFFYVSFGKTSHCPQSMSLYERWKLIELLSVTFVWYKATYPCKRQP